MNSMMSELGCSTTNHCSDNDISHRKIVLHLFNSGRQQLMRTTLGPSRRVKVFKIRGCCKYSKSGTNQCAYWLLNPEFSLKSQSTSGPSPGVSARAVCYHRIWIGTSVRLNNTACFCHTPTLSAFWNENFVLSLFGCMSGSQFGCYLMMVLGIWLKQ